MEEAQVSINRRVKYRYGINIYAVIVLSGSVVSDPL